MDISMDISMDLSMDIHIHGKPGYTPVATPLFFILIIFLDLCIVSIVTDYLRIQYLLKLMQWRIIYNLQQNGSFYKGCFHDNK